MRSILAALVVTVALASPAAARCRPYGDGLMICPHPLDPDIQLVRNENGDVVETVGTDPMAEDDDDLTPDIILRMDARGNMHRFACDDFRCMEID